MTIKTENGREMAFEVPLRAENREGGFVDGFANIRLSDNRIFWVSSEALLFAIAHSAALGIHGFSVKGNGYDPSTHFAVAGVL